MNHIAKLNKHLRIVREVISNIRGEESRGKAMDAVSKLYMDVFMGFTTVNEVPSVVVVKDALEEVGGATVPVGEESAPKAQETVKETVLEPVSDHDHEVLVKVEHEKIEKVPEGAVEIGGWPVEGRVTIMGLAANRRSLRGILEDKRGVCVERHFRTWKVGENVRVGLIRAGANPLYRVMQ